MTGLELEYITNMLSEGDRQLQMELNTSVQRLNESNQKLYKPALKILETHIMASRISMTSVSKPLMFLSSHYDTLKTVYDKMDDKLEKKMCASIISVLVMTLGNNRHDGESLKFRRLGIRGCWLWGHDFVRHIAKQVFVEWQDLTGTDSELEERLVNEIRGIVIYHMTHDAVIEGCDFLMKTERLDLLQYCVDECCCYIPACLYLTSCIPLIKYPENLTLLKTVVELIRMSDQYPEALAKQLNDKTFMEEIVFQYSIRMDKYLPLEDYIKAGALLACGIVNSDSNHKLSHLCQPSQQLDSCTLGDVVSVCKSGPAACVCSVDLNFARAEPIEVTEQVCTEICTPVPVKASSSCTVRVDGVELCSTRVAEKVETWSQVESEGTNIVPCDKYIPVPLTFHTELYRDNECKGQSVFTPDDVTEQSASCVPFGIKPTTRQCDYSFMLARQHAYFIAWAKYNHSHGLYAQTNQMLALNDPGGLSMFKHAIGRSLFNKEKTDDLLVDLLWPG